MVAHTRGQLSFYGSLSHLAEEGNLKDYLAPLRKIEWVVYAKRPFAGPEAVLAYLSRYTHRVAIANSRLISCNSSGVTFKWKDYRDRGQTKQKVMTLKTPEFIRRFLIHVLPHGFHRIRHYGLFANARRALNLVQIRKLLGVAEDLHQPDTTPESSNDNEPQSLAFPCPCCGGRMIVIETFERCSYPRGPPLQLTKGDL